jgi:hypothetical protein
MGNKALKANSHGQWICHIDMSLWMIIFLSRNGYIKIRLELGFR